MIFLKNIFKTQPPLKGINIWLSGAVPEREHWSHKLVDREILEFISVFSTLVFKNGGTIIHGSQPSLTPILKRSAHRFAYTKEQLQLFISSHFKELSSVEPSGNFSETVIPAQYGEHGFNRDLSLLHLRQAMVPQAHFAIFIGGKLHLESDFKAGVPEEMHLAEKLKVPSFILGGVDGISQKYVQENYLREMNQIIDIENLKAISLEKNLSIIPAHIVGLIINNRRKILRSR